MLLTWGRLAKVLSCVGLGDRRVGGRWRVRGLRLVWSTTTTGCSGAGRDPRWVRACVWDLAVVATVRVVGHDVM